MFESTARSLATSMLALLPPYLWEVTGTELNIGPRHSRTTGSSSKPRWFAPRRVGGINRVSCSAGQCSCL